MRLTSAENTRAAAACREIDFDVAISNDAFERRLREVASFQKCVAALPCRILDSQDLLSLTAASFRQVSPCPAGTATKKTGGTVRRGGNVAVRELLKTKLE